MTLYVTLVCCYVSLLFRSVFWLSLSLHLNALRQQKAHNSHIHSTHTEKIKDKVMIQGPPLT